MCYYSSRVRSPEKSGILHCDVGFVDDVLLQVIMPGYCVSGTIGWKILNGHKKIEFENRQTVSVVSCGHLVSCYHDEVGWMKLFYISSFKYTSFYEPIKAV